MGTNSVADATLQANLKMEHVHLGITLVLHPSTTSLPRAKAHKDLRDVLAKLFPGRINSVNECLTPSGIVDHTVVTFNTVGNAINCAVIWLGVWKDYSKCFLRGPVTRGNRPDARTSSAGNKAADAHPRPPAIQPPSVSTRPKTFVLTDEDDEDEFISDEESTQDPTDDVSHLFDGNVPGLTTFCLGLGDSADPAASQSSPSYPGGDRERQGGVSSVHSRVVHQPQLRRPFQR
jgi:hypothetical protein